MSSRRKAELTTADALLKPHVETSMKEVLTMKHHRSQQQMRESDVVGVKQKLGDKASKQRCGQIISKLGERSHLVDVNGKSFPRNQKFLRATSE